MVLKSMKINHEADNFHDALNMTVRQQERCRERVFFAAFSNALQAEELYEDPSDAPAEFHTKTGDLSRTLQLITDPLEYEYTLLMFMKLQPMAQDTYAKYKAMNSDRLSRSDKSKLDIMMHIHDLLLRHKNEEEQEENDNAHVTITPGSLIKRIDLVKRSHYNWDTYFNLISSKNFYYTDEKKFGEKERDDINDMLRNIFGKEDDE